MKICSNRTLIGLDVHYFLTSKAPGCDLHHIFLVCGNPDEPPYHYFISAESESF